MPRYILPNRTSSLLNTARICSLTRLVRVFIGVHRQELSVPQIGGQDTKQIMPALESNASTQFERVTGWIGLHSYACVL